MIPKKKISKAIILCLKTGDETDFKNIMANNFDIYLYNRYMRENFTFAKYTILDYIIAHENKYPTKNILHFLSILIPHICKKYETRHISYFIYKLCVATNKIQIYEMLLNNYIENINHIYRKNILYNLLSNSSTNGDIKYCGAHNNLIRRKVQIILDIGAIYGQISSSHYLIIEYYAYTFARIKMISSSYILPQVLLNIVIAYIRDMG